MSAMQVEIKAPSELSAQEREAWTLMRASNPALYSPYFHVDYAQAVGALKPEAKVLIARRNDEIICFLAFEGQGFARPIGSPMTDYHGFICHPNAEFDPVSVLRQAGIGVYRFDHLASSVAGLERFAIGQQETATLDLSKGIEAWRSEQDKSYHKNRKSTSRRERKAEAEIGPRQVSFNVKDPDVLETLLRWKREQFDQTGLYDVLATEWTQKLLRQLWEKPAEPEQLRIDMHTLHFGDKLAAVDMGLTAGRCYHSWIVAYDPEFHKYSPGSQLLEDILSCIDQLGYTQFDLGAGTEGYKRYYASDPLTVHHGFIAAKGPAKLVTKAYAAVEGFGEKAPLGKVGKLPGKLRRRYSQIAACDTTVGGRTKALLSAVKNSGKG